jgi:zinc and cadmium transporter
MNVIAISPLVLLTLYCLVVFLAALAGGWLPALFQLTHSRLQTAISFVGGLMLGLACSGCCRTRWNISVLPPTLRWLLAGFLGMFLLQRFLPFHHHDVAEGSPWSRAAIRIRWRSAGRAT